MSVIDPKDIAEAFVMEYERVFAEAFPHDICMSWDDLPDEYREITIKTIEKLIADGWIVTE